MENTTRADELFAVQGKGPIEKLLPLGEKELNL